jgi:hypothetical protein
MNIIVTMECGWCRANHRHGESAVAIFAVWPTPEMLDDFCARQLRDHHADHPGGMSVRFSVEGRPEYRPGVDDDGVTP